MASFRCALEYDAGLVAKYEAELLGKWPPPDQEKAYATGCKHAAGY